jgi:Fur family ferric uptake transcriptional regulator
MTAPAASSSPGPAAGRRPSRRRDAVVALLDEVDGFRSAQEIHQLLRGRGAAVGLATVYRALQALVDDGGVDVLHGADGEAAYRRCSPVHHHHLVCRTCGRSEEVVDLPVERWAARVAASHGFVDVRHQVELFGTCAGCSPAR